MQIKGLFPVKIDDGFAILKTSVDLDEYMPKITEEIMRLEKEYDRLMKQIDVMNNLFISDFIVNAPHDIVMDKYTKLAWMENRTESLNKIIATLRGYIKHELYKE
ncbi:MAG: hypothetical protein IJ341_09540 [Bacteroidales bacterium]|nr:hypothetical protein [Bacteroidales bacterium]